MGKMFNTKQAVLTIRFEDRGQDFLEWDVDYLTGKVLESRPFQTTIWGKYYVDGARHLKKGDSVQISKEPINPKDLDQEFLTINYRVADLKIVPNGKQKYSL
jgi:hypothetical protein